MKPNEMTIRQAHEALVKKEFSASDLLQSCLDRIIAIDDDKVKAFIRYNSRNNWGWLERSEYKSDLEILPGDIRDFDSVYNALKGSTNGHTPNATPFAICSDLENFSTSGIL